MNFTLHLTEDYNFACRYCYETHSAAHMTEDVADQAVDLLFSYGHPKNGFSLFGGEPLLERALIMHIAERAAAQAQARGVSVRYKLTTNGSLLDASFLQAAQRYGIEVALSHDGLLQDVQRVTPSGKGTLAMLEPKIDLLLGYQPNAIAMLTIPPENVSMLASSVQWLYERGFSRILTTIDYRRDAAWDDDSMAELARQYGVMAQLADAHYDDARPLHLLQFESKIQAYLNDRPCMQCKLGVRQPSITPDGKLYPCNQFVGVAAFCMGDVKTGVDQKALHRIHKEASLQEPDCAGCAIWDRCRHHCACLNYSMTGDLHTVSPVQCTHERILIPIADALAESLYQRNSLRFLQQLQEDDLT